MLTRLEFVCSDEKSVVLLKASRLYDEGHREIGPVLRGHWTEDGACSECGKYDNRDPYGSKFCPNCGATMDKGRDEP